MMETRARARIPVAGGELHVEWAGEGPPVVLLHSGSFDSRMWEPQFTALADAFRVVVFDSRSHGRSSTATGDWHPDDDLLAVLDALSLRRAALVGSSFGGATALDLALRHPDRVSALALVGGGVNPPEFRDPFVLEQHRRQAAAAEARDPEAFVEAVLRYAVDGAHRSPAESPAEVREACRAMGIATVSAHAASAGRPLPRDTAPHLERITAPTLVVLGELELADIVRAGQDAARRIPGARLAEIPGVAHMASMERPDECTALLRVHLERYAR